MLPTGLPEQSQKPAISPFRPLCDNHRCASGCQFRPRPKSIYRALLYSLVLPGTGSEYAGNRGTAIRCALVGAFACFAFAIRDGDVWSVVLVAVAWVFSLAQAYFDVIDHNRFYYGNARGRRTP